MSKTILLLTAHADDCEFFAGGTIAKLIAQGARVVEIIATDNARGSFDLDSGTLVSQSRNVEAQNAAKVMGKAEVRFLEYPDGFLGDTPVNELREIYFRAIRELRPDVVFSFDPYEPFEPHPDHRKVAWAASEALAFSNMPLFHPEHREQGLEPHVVPERYFFAKSPTRSNTVVDIGDFIDKKIEALCAHDSQMKAMIDDLKMSLLATGRFAQVLPLLDRDNYRPALETFIRAWAGKVGERIGVDAAEEFRIERCDELFDGLID
ncbi:MAG: PIG-L deacetylase family protein [Candidatus Alcyoniella australis]|nr:PIG-L deacetylase family protein [Candidatus Alcyoniella australis]